MAEAADGAPVWIVDEHGPRSLTDPKGDVTDGISHSRMPPDYLVKTGPEILVTSRPVPRVLRHGLLVIPDMIDAVEPWSRLDLVVDVLRRRDDLLVAGPAPVWQMRKADASGSWDCWIHVLDGPLDMAWLHAHAWLPLDLRFFDSWFGDPGIHWISDGPYVIRGAAA